ncbi:hypothetical protein GCM10020360_08030 [Nonlabens tegetincola]
MQNAVREGLLASHRFGNSLGVYERQVFALRRMRLAGRRWEGATLVAALDVLSGLPVTTLHGSQLSRLKARLRTMPDAGLAGHVLAGKASLYRAGADRGRESDTIFAGQAALVGGGTSVIVEPDANRLVASLGFTPDPEGNVIAIDGDPRHYDVIAALVYTVYGATRERSAGARLLRERRSESLPMR